MPWVRLDDGYPEHPKVDRVGPMAAWLNVCAWAYCARNLTDGFVPAERVARLATVPSPAKLAAALVEANLWEVAEGGYMVHDYLSYNPSRDQVMGERARTAERVAKHRNAGGNGVTPPATNGVSNTRSTPVGNGVSTPAPYPSRSRPVPDTPIDERDEDGIPPVASRHPPGERRRLTIVDAAFEHELLDRFSEAFGSTEACRDVIDDAVGFEPKRPHRNQRAFVRNWVRKEAEQAVARRHTRNGLALVDPESEVVAVQHEIEPKRPKICRCDFIHAALVSDPKAFPFCEVHGDQRKTML